MAKTKDKRKIRNGYVVYDNITKQYLLSWPSQSWGTGFIGESNNLIGKLFASERLSQNVVKKLNKIFSKEPLGANFSIFKMKYKTTKIIEVTYWEEIK